MSSLSACVKRFFISSGLGTASSHVPTGAFPPSAGQLPAWTRGQWARLLGWIAAVGLTIYGGVLTAVGLLVQGGVVDAADDADQRALAWHAFLWDPWFALWGAASIVVMWRSRPQAPD